MLRVKGLHHVNKAVCGAQLTEQANSHHKSCYHLPQPATWWVNAFRFRNIKLLGHLLYF